MQTDIDFGLLGKAGQEPAAYDDGAFVFRQGDTGDLAFIVHSGCIELRRDGTVFETAGPGVIFGEMALVEPGPRSTDAVAVGSAAVVPMNQLTFFTLIAEQPEFSLNVLRLMARRIRASAGDAGAD